MLLLALLLPLLLLGAAAVGLQTVAMLLLVIVVPIKPIWWCVKQGLQQAERTNQPADLAGQYISTRVSLQ